MMFENARGLTQKPARPRLTKSSSLAGCIIVKHVHQQQHTTSEFRTNPLNALTDVY